MKEIKSFIKTASFTELQKAAELINNAMEKQQAQQEAKAELLALIKDKGLTVEDLLDGVGQDKRSKVAIKYRIEKDGEVFEWTGRGKRPKAFIDVDLAQYAV